MMSEKPIDVDNDNQQHFEGQKTYDIKMLDAIDAWKTASRIEGRRRYAEEIIRIIEKEIKDESAKGKFMRSCVFNHDSVYRAVCLRHPEFTGVHLNHPEWIDACEDVEFILKEHGYYAHMEKHCNAFGKEHVNFSISWKNAAKDSGEKEK